MRESYIANKIETIEMGAVAIHQRWKDKRRAMINHCVCLEIDRFAAEFKRKLTDEVCKIAETQ